MYYSSDIPIDNVEAEMLSDRWMFRKGYDEPVPGLIRMDRALLYILRRLRSVVDEIERRNTKTLGEHGYAQIRLLLREVFQLCEIGGDRLLADLVAGEVRSLSTRTPRTDAIAILRNAAVRLETYEPSDSFTGERLQRERGLEDSTGDTERVTDEQLSSERTVFVIMPFSTDLSDVWKGGIQRAAKEEGFTPIRVDMINRSSNITEDIVASIDKCRLAIVDVTGNNPNVMFELGYAIAKAKKNIIISQSADFLPFDIRHIRTIVYANTWSGIEDLKGRIQEFLREAVPPKHAPRKQK